MFTLIDETVFKIIFGMILLLTFLGVSPIREERLEKTFDIFLAKTRRFLMVMSFALTALSCALLWYLFNGTEIELTEYLIYKLQQNKWSLILMFLGTFILKVVYYRYFKVWVSDVYKKFVNKIDTEKLSDIKETLGKYVAPKFNPLKYVDLNKGLFVGLDSETLKPVYISEEDYKECHKEIIGASRSGKGVSACVLAYQCILLGWSVFYIDPKPDKFVSRIMLKACKKMKKKLLVIDLVDGKKGQYAPFRGGSLMDIKSRVKDVLKIRRTGGDADFYKGQEINLLDRALNETNRGTRQIYEFLHENRPDKKVATGIEDIFKELNEMHQINTKNGAVPKNDDMAQLLYPAQSRNRHTGGISIAKTIMEGGVVYIRGDTSDTNVRNMVKLLLTEITQEVKRLHIARNDEKHVSIVMDEGKFVMSEALSAAMATIAGFDCDMTVQYQALEDIETSIEKDVDMKALAAALHVNTQIKLIHGGMAPRTAEYLEEQSGTIIKTITAMDRVSVESLGAEQWSGEKMVRDQEESLFTRNDFLAMGKLTFALLERGKLAHICYSAFINVEDEPNYQQILEGKTSLEEC